MGLYIRVPGPSIKRFNEVSMCVLQVEGSIRKYISGKLVPTVTRKETVGFDTSILFYKYLLL